MRMIVFNESLYKNRFFCKFRERSRIEVRRIVSGLGFLAVAMAFAPSGLCGVMTAAAWSTAVFAIKPKSPLTDDKKQASRGKETKKKQ
jgi:hypothetical protein